MSTGMDCTRAVHFIIEMECFNRACLRKYRRILVGRMCTELIRINGWVGNWDHLAVFIYRFRLYLLQYANSLVKDLLRMC